jgi:type I restriction enzyme, S subunit
VTDLPSGWALTTLNVVGLPRSTTIDPRRYPDEVFELYSVPSYLDGAPEIVAGSKIGSTKQVVSPGDVLLCKIVPHLVRVWVVPERSAYRQIASGEWIVIRCPESDAHYLRYLLTEPQFRDQFMATVSGVGGSLLRARPSEVARIPLPVAPLPEQRRIVTKLDSLFARTRSAREELARIPRLIEHYKQAILAAAFRGELTADMRSAGEPLEGGPWPIPPDWTWRTFADVGQVQSNLVSASEVLDFPHIAPNHIESGIPRLLPFATVREDGVKSPKHRFFPGQILYSKIRPYLRKAVVVDFEGVCSADMYPISPDGADPLFVLYWLISPDFNSLSIAHQGRTVLPKINQKALYSIPTPVPPLSEQRRIGERLSRAFSDMHGLLAEANKARVLLGNLDQSTLAKAFRGELVPQDPNDEPAAKLLERIRAARAAEPKPKRRRRTAAEPSASTQET